MFFFYFFHFSLADLNYCIYRGDKSVCPSSYETQIDLNHPSPISFPDKPSPVTVNFLFTADMDMNKPSELILDNIAISINITTMNLIGLSQRRIISFEALINYFPALTLYMENVTVCTSNSILLTKVGHYKNVLFSPTLDYFSLCGTNEIKVDMACLANIYKLESNSIIITTNNYDNSPRKTNVYIEGYNSSVNLQFINITKDLFFDVKYHGYDVTLFDTDENGIGYNNKTIRFIPKPMNAFVCLFSLDLENLSVYVSNLFISETVRLSSMPNKIIFDPQRGTKFTFFDAYWGNDLSSAFTIYGNKPISIKSIATIIPLYFNVKDAEKIDFYFENHESHLDISSINNTDIYLHSQKNHRTLFHLNTFEYWNSRMYALDEDMNVLIDNALLYDTSCLGNGNYILKGVYELEENMNYTFENVFLTGTAQFDMNYNKSLPINFHIENIRKTDNGEILLKIDTLDNTVDDIVCSPNKTICDSVKAIVYDPQKENGVEFYPTCEINTAKDNNFCLTFTKISPHKNYGFYCIATNKEELDKCPSDYNKTLASDFKMPTDVTTVTLFVCDSIVDSNGNLVLIDLSSTNPLLNITINGYSEDVDMKVKLSHTELLIIENINLTLANDNNKLSTRRLSLDNCTLNNLDLINATESISLTLTAHIISISLYTPTFNVYNANPPIIYTDDTSVIIGTQIYGVPEENIRNTKIYIYFDEKAPDCMLILSGKASGCVNIISTNTESTLSIGSNYSDMSFPCHITWYGSISIASVESNLPVSLSVKDCIFIISSNNKNIKLRTLNVTGDFDPSVEQSFSVQTFILHGDGKILKSNNHEIIIDDLYVETTTFQSTEQLKPRRVHVSKSALTKLSLQSEDLVDFYINYSVSSVPYIEVEMKEGAPKGRLVLDNVDETTEYIFARSDESDVVVDILCAQQLNCAEWSFEFTQPVSNSSAFKNSTDSIHNIKDYFSIDCRKGTYNNALMCLSLVNKQPTTPSEPLQAWEIALIVIGCVLGIALIVIISLYVAGKVKRIYERKIIYKGLDNSILNQPDSDENV